MDRERPDDEAGRVRREALRSVRDYLFDDLFGAQSRRIVGRPVRDFFEQSRAIIAEVQVEVISLRWCDLVVAELDVVWRVGIALNLLEDEAYAAVALLIGQRLAAVARIPGFQRPSVLEERHRVAFDRDPLDVGFITDLVIGLVLFDSLRAAFRLMRHDWVERPVLQIAVDGLPVAFPVQESTILDLAILEVSLVDLVIAMIVGVGMIV